MSNSNASTPTFVMERVFNAPRDTVWRAWTEPELIARWLGPKGCETRVLEHRLEPGGVNHFEMRSGDAPPSYGKFVFEEVVAPERIRWRHMFSDADGGVIRHPGQPDWPLVLMTTMELTEEGDKTRLRLTWVPVDAKPEELAVFRDGMDGMHAGWEGSFAMLDVLLGTSFDVDGPGARIAGKLTIVTQGDDTIVITRGFAARKEEVFDAFTKPELLEQWMLGPGEEWSLTCELDLQPGGSGRYDWASKSGQKMGLNVTFVAVEPPDRLVHRELFDEDWTGGETIITTEFTEAAGETTVTMTIVYGSAEARDAVLDSPMASGMEAGYTRLDSLFDVESRAR